MIKTSEDWATYLAILVAGFAGLYQASPWWIVLSASALSVVTIFNCWGVYKQAWEAGSTATIAFGAWETVKLNGGCSLISYLFGRIVSWVFS